MTHPKIPLSTTPLTDNHNASLATLPALFISHGAPTLAVEKSTTTNALHRIGQNLPKPKAIIMMSAHWQSSHLEINSNPKPTTWHDFTGFDNQLYKISYPACGHHALAESLAHQLQEQNIACTLNPVRAFDHGVWTPLLHLYPQADIPIVQISLPHHFDSYSCYQLGNLFASLRKQQILLIGSGNITHNLGKLKWQAESEDNLAKAFKVWLLNRLKHDVPSALDWKSFNNVRQVHPTDEHILPLFWVLGAGQRVSVVHESMAHHSLGMDILRFD